MLVIFSVFLGLAFAQSDPKSGGDTGSVTPHLQSEAGAARATTTPTERPPTLSSKTLEFEALTDDPGFSRWFDGAIRVERGDDVLFSIASGNDVGGEPLDQDSLFWVGSISKTFCATAVLHLVDEGKLALDDPIGQHLPGWEPTDATVDGQVCTVARLLAHECGFPREPTNLDMIQLKDPLRNQANRGPFLEAARGVALEFTPGTDMMYSNVGYQLAGLIVLAKDEGSYDEILQRRIFAPLGLKRTGTEPSRVPDFFERIAPMTVTMGTAALPATRWLGLPEDAPSRVGAAGNAFSTAKELTRFFEALSQGGILKPDTFAEMTRPRQASKHYGLGIVLRDRDGTAEYSHNGALDPHGFSAHVSTFPTWDTTVTVLVARSSMVTSATGIAQRVIDGILSKDYRSPFPESVMDWLSANLIALMFLVVPVWMLIVVVGTSVREIRKPRLSWALGAVGPACVLIFLRGLLGMHRDGFDLWIWPGSVGGVVAAMVWWRLRNEHQQPVLDIPSSGWRRVTGWMSLISAVVAMPAVGWLGGLYALHFTLLIAFAIACAVRRSNPTSKPIV